MSPTLPNVHPGRPKHLSVNFRNRSYCSRRPGFLRGILKAAVPPAPDVCNAIPLWLPRRLTLLLSRQQRFPRQLHGRGGLDHLYSFLLFCEFQFLLLVLLLSHPTPLLTMPVLHDSVLGPPPGFLFSHFRGEMIHTHLHVEGFTCL